jgi:hypothetical protein
MADNIAVTPGSGATVAADDIGGVLYQRVKLALGADGTGVDASAGAGAVGTGVQRVTLASDDPAVTALGTINTTLGTPMKSTGGTVGLVAGSAIIGSVGIDQTTDGTTNLVAAKQSGTWNITNVSGTVSLPTGAATSANQTALAGLIGEVQASPTANTLLDRVKALLTGTVLAAGTALIGKVGIDQTTDGTTNKVSAVQNGTWNVTNVSGTVSLPTGASTAAKQPALGTAGTPSSDVITVQGIASATPITTAAAPATGAVYNGVTALTPKFATIALSATGTVVAAVTSKKIRVLAVQLISNGTVNAKWQSSTTSDLTGLAYLVANAGYVLPFNPCGWFETVSGELLTLSLSASIAVGGSIVYVEV